MSTTGIPKIKQLDNKIGNLTDNGLTEDNLALAIKNDRSQLAAIPNQTYITDKALQADLVTTNENVALNTANIESIDTNKVSVSTFNATINSVGNGTPLPYNGTLAVLQADEIADKTKFYVIMDVSDTTYYKHKAYWNGTAWSDGGAYEKTVFNVGEITSDSNLYANFCNDFDINSIYNVDTTGVLTQESGNLKVTYAVQPSYSWTMLGCKTKRMCYKPLTNGATFVPIMIVPSLTAIHALNMDSGTFLNLQNFAYNSGNLVSGSSATATSLGIATAYPTDLDYFVFDTYEDDTDRIDLGYVSTAGIYTLLRQLSVSALSTIRYSSANYPATATLGLVSSMSRIMGGHPLAQVLLSFNSLNMHNVLNHNDLLKIKARLLAIETTFGLKLTGKKIAILGDSITAHDGASVWVNVIESLTGATVTRYGVSGTMIQGSSANQSFISRYTAIASDTDIIIIEGGTNDWGNNGALGVCNYTDDENTLYGALNILLKGIQNNYPNAITYVCTPPQRNFSGTGTTAGMGLNGATPAWTFEDCQIAIKTMARYYGAEIIDFFANLGWSANNVALFTDDGLHPNITKGYPRMGYITVKCINYSMVG